MAPRRKKRGTASAEAGAANLAAWKKEGFRACHLIGGQGVVMVEDRKKPTDNGSFKAVLRTLNESKKVRIYK